VAGAAKVSAAHQPSSWSGGIVGRFGLAEHLRGIGISQRRRCHHEERTRLNARYLLAQSQIQRHLGDTSTQCCKWLAEYSLGVTTRLITHWLCSGDRREEWHLSGVLPGRGAVALGRSHLPSCPANPLQKGKSSSSASKASGKSSNPSFPLGPAAPAATLLGALNASAPSPLPESRISSRPLISVV
jgi:hypothetical protein